MILTRCKHLTKDVSAYGEVYCPNCGAILGYRDRCRPCGCPADPGVFGHMCRERAATPMIEERP